MEKIRMDKFIASQLNISRADAKKVIKSGRVTLNGEVVRKCDVLFDAETSEVYVDGTKTEYKKYLYIMLNKPQGVVSASESPVDVTVIDILPDELKRPGLFPAGRLDKDTTGFVLITDDGGFAHSILSPKHHVPKNYSVYVPRELTPEEVDRFCSGMTVGNITFMEASIELKGFDDVSSTYVYSVTINEGKYHQIKKMFAALGDPLVKLHRNSIGGLALDSSLLPGQARELSADEINKVRLQ